MCESAENSFIDEHISQMIDSTNEGDCFPILQCNSHIEVVKRITLMYQIQDKAKQPRLPENTALISKIKGKWDIY